MTAPAGNLLECDRNIYLRRSSNYTDHEASQKASRRHERVSNLQAMASAAADLSGTRCFQDTMSKRFANGLVASISAQIDFCCNSTDFINVQWFSNIVIARVVSTSVALRFRRFLFQFLFTSPQCHLEFILISLRCHFDVISVLFWLFRVRADVHSDSKSTSLPLRMHFDFFHTQMILDKNRWWIHDWIIPNSWPRYIKGWEKQKM